MQRDFSLVLMHNAFAARTWDSVGSFERTRSAELSKKYGAVEDGFWSVPNTALSTRDLTASVPSAGGYLGAVQQLGYVDTLRPASYALTLGAQIASASKSSGAVVPKGNGGITITWQATETQQATESTPQFLQVSGTPKLLLAYCEVSRQSLLQSNSEEVLRRELRAAAGAALDAAIFAGDGASGSPLGIINSTGVQTFTGASLNQAALRNAQFKVTNANAVFGPTSYVTTPGVAEVLSTRQRFTGSDNALWEGALHDGMVEGCRAVATNNIPTATALHGDFSSVWVVQWDGGLQIAFDPYTKFSAGITGVRMLLPVDVFVTRPTSFAVATGVS